MWHQGRNRAGSSSSSSSDGGDGGDGGRCGVVVGVMPRVVAMVAGGEVGSGRGRRGLMVQVTREQERLIKPPLLLVLVTQVKGSRLKSEHMG